MKQLKCDMVVAGHPTSDLKFEKGYDGQFDTFSMFIGYRQEKFIVGDNASGKFKIMNHKIINDSFVQKILEKYITEQYLSIN